MAITTMLVTKYQLFILNTEAVLPCNLILNHTVGSIIRNQIISAIQSLVSVLWWMWFTYPLQFYFQQRGRRRSKGFAQLLCTNIVEDDEETISVKNTIFALLGVSWHRLTGLWLKSVLAYKNVFWPHHSPPRPPRERVHQCFLYFCFIKITL